jgi:hypothetical protein
MVQYEIRHGTQAEQEEGMAIQPVFEALPARSLQILVDGQDQHIFIVDEIEAALFQLAEMGVMDCMGPAPMLVI